MQKIANTRFDERTNECSYRHMLRFINPSTVTLWGSWKSWMCVDADNAFGENNRVCCCHQNHTQSILSIHLIQKRTRVEKKALRNQEHGRKTKHAPIQLTLLKCLWKKEQTHTKQLTPLKCFWKKEQTHSKKSHTHLYDRDDSQSVDKTK